MAKRIITQGAGDEIEAYLDNVAKGLKNEEQAKVDPSTFDNKEAWLSESTGRSIGETLGDIATSAKGIADGTLAVGRLANTLTINGTSYDGSEAVNMNIGESGFANAEVELEDSPTYDGTLKTQGIKSVVLDGVELKEGVDYMVAGNTGVEPGTYGMVIIGMGEYYGTKGVTWYILKGVAEITLTGAPTALVGYEGIEISFGYETNGDGEVTAACDNDCFECDVDMDSKTVTIRCIKDASELVEDANVTVTVADGALVEGTSVTLDLKAYSPDPELENNDWDVISAVSNAGVAANIWGIGDMKSVTLNGDIGEYCSCDALELYVYIIGFNHNSEVEGVTGITFQGFKTAEGVSVGLINDSGYGLNHSSGIYFNMNHWGNHNYGGWKASDLRYDVLGSTDVAPSNYGSEKTTTDVGYDPTEECTANPVANTLMAALPESLRSVLKAVTKYTDNTGNSSTAAENVTASLDYLFLLAEWELFGASTYANTNEAEYQEQYEYYSMGNDKIKYQHSNPTSTCWWWARSPRRGTATGFCGVNSGGAASSDNAYIASALAPAFVV